MDKKNIRKVRNFFKFRKDHWEELSNYPSHDLKKSHGRRGKNALKVLGELLELEEIKVHYNPSGIIDGGYLTLIGMRGDKGIYVSLSCSGLGKDILYRTVQHMEDYTGGSNNFLSTSEFIEDPEKCIEKMKKLILI